MGTEPNKKWHQARLSHIIAILSKNYHPEHRLKTKVRALEWFKSLLRVIK